MNVGQDEQTENVRETVTLLLEASKTLLDAAESLMRLAEGESNEPERPQPSTSAEKAGPTAGDMCLTARELQVLETLGRGRTNRQIGRALGISDHTVRSHLQSVYRKLGAGHRTEAILLAQRAGVIQALPPQARLPQGANRPGARGRPA